MHLQSKPARDNNANGLGVLGVPSYAMGSYGGGAAIGGRPPPPIQMYSIDDTPEDHQGPTKLFQPPKIQKLFQLLESSKLFQLLKILKLFQLL